MIDIKLGNRWKLFGIVLLLLGAILFFSLGTLLLTTPRGSDKGINWLAGILYNFSLFLLILFILQLLEYTGKVDNFRRSRKPGYKELSQLKTENGYYYQNANLIIREDNVIEIGNDLFEYYRAIVYTALLIIFLGGSMLVLTIVSFTILGAELPTFDDIINLRVSFDTLITPVFLFIIFYDIARMIDRSNTLKREDRKIRIFLDTNEIVVSSNSIQSMVPNGWRFDSSLIRNVTIEESNSYFGLVLPKSTTNPDPSLASYLSIKTKGYLIYPFYHRDFAEEILQFMIQLLGIVQVE